MSKLVEDISLFKPEMVVGCICDDVVFAPALNCNGLFEINVETGCVELADVFPNEKYSQNYISVTCIKVEKKIIFAPYYGKRIYIFDILDRSIKSIETDFIINGISRMIECHKKIYMFSQNAGYIVCFDPYKEKVIGKIDLCDSMGVKVQRKYALSTDCVIYKYKDCVYWPLWNEPVIMKMDLSANNITSIEIKGLTSGIVQMFGRVNELIILGKENKLVFQNLDDLENTHIYELPSNIRAINYRDSFLLNDNIIFWSNISDEMIEINKNKIGSVSKKAKLDCHIDENFVLLKNDYNFLILISEDERLFLKNWDDDSTKMINLNYKIQDEFYKHIIDEPILITERKNDLMKYLRFISSKCQID